MGNYTIKGTEHESELKPLLSNASFGDTPFRLRLGLDVAHKIDYSLY